MGPDLNVPRATHRRLEIFRSVHDLDVCWQDRRLSCLSTHTWTLLRWHRRRLWRYASTGTVSGWLR